VIYLHEIEASRTGKSELKENIIRGRQDGERRETKGKEERLWWKGEERDATRSSEIRENGPRSTIAVSREKGWPQLSSPSLQRKG